MRKFKALLFKELRELLTPQVLVPLVVIVAMFSLIGDVVGREAEKATGANSIAVVDNDGSEGSRAVVESLRQAGFTPRMLPALNEKDVAEDLPAGTSIAVVIPDGFGAGIAAATPQDISSYAVMDDFSMAATRQGQQLKSVLEAVSEAASDQLIAGSAAGVDPSAFREPLRLDEHVVIGPKMAAASAEDVIGFIGSQTTFIPVVLFMVIIFAAQMIATTIATEKENKTLETLLSVPVGRVSLVTAKMVAAGIVALASAAVYLLGMRNYMQGLTGMEMGGGAPEALSQLGLTLSTSDYVLLGASLFFGILVALGIAVILGAFAENVKAVQSLLAPLIILIMVPYFLTMFIDVGSASPMLRGVLYAIPFSHPFMAAPNLFLDDVMPVIAGIGYQALWFAGFALAAARIFSSDRILTMKLSLGRKRRYAGRGTS